MSKESQNHIIAHVRRCSKTPAKRPILSGNVPRLFAIVRVGWCTTGVNEPRHNIATPAVLPKLDHPICRKSERSRGLVPRFHHPSEQLSKPKVSGATKPTEGRILTVPATSLERRAPPPPGGRPRPGGSPAPAPANYGRS